MTGGTRVEPVVWDQVGAVPVVWQAAPGPVIAAVGFRVGRADEALARSGLTHLVEHLALAGLGDPLYDYDGFVNGTMTWFGFRGTGDELVEYLDHVGRSLTSLPLDRLEAELGVLRAEEDRRAATLAGRCLVLRFGTRGWGTYDLPQYGLHTVTPELVSDWAAGWFGTGNAVIWMTGAPPDRLGLDLPAVAARAEPAVTPLPERSFPAWATHRRPVTAISVLVPRSVEAVAAAAILQGRLRHVLRDLDGSSYDVSLAVDHLDDHTTHVLVTADGPATTAVDALGAVTEALATDGPTDEELAHQRALLGRKLADPAFVPGRLATLAGARLCGWSVPAPDDEGRRLDTATRASMAALVERALTTAVYLIPVGTPFPASLGSPICDPPAAPVHGRALRAAGRRGDRRRRLVVGAAGVTELRGERSVTVRSDQATAVLAWHNGARLLVGPDGTALTVDPGRWAGVAKALAVFDAAVPASVVVPMGERPDWSVGPGGHPGRRRSAAAARLARTPGVGLGGWCQTRFGGPTGSTAAAASQVRTPRRSAAKQATRLHASLLGAASCLLWLLAALLLLRDLPLWAVVASCTAVVTGVAAFRRSRCAPAGTRG